MTRVIASREPRPCESCSTIGLRFASGQASANTPTSWPGPSWRPHRRPGEELVLFSSSWKDRLDPAVVPGATAVDRRLPNQALNFAWHRLGWPPVERLAGGAISMSSTRFIRC